jgi:ferredoxin-type protein NapF
MASNINRAQFLRGNFTGRHNLLRPPWALPESEFVDICTRCDQCISVCPEKILGRGHAGFPQIDFNKGECTFCEVCVTQCESAALQKQLGQPAWQLKAVVNTACLTNQGVICSVCAEQCDPGAIRFVFQVGKVPSPEIKLDSCTGCGACYRPCPANAITIQTSNTQSLFQNEIQPTLSEVMS